MEMDKGDGIRKSMEEATVSENTEIGDCMLSVPSMSTEHEPCHSIVGLPFQDSRKMLIGQLSVECIPENNCNASNNEDATNNEGNCRGNFENNNINSHMILCADGNNTSDGYYLKTHDVSNKVKCEIAKPSHIEIYSGALTHDEITVTCPNLDVISGEFAKSCNPGADDAPGINGGLKMDEGGDIDAITNLDFNANSNITVNKELTCSDNIACRGSNRPSSTSSIANGIAEGGEKTNWIEVKDELETVTSQIDEESKTKPHVNLMHEVDSKCIRQSFNWETQLEDGSESGTEEEQATFMMELENFYKERNLEFKPPKFYGEGLNCLKLWRAVIRLGGYDQVTSCKLWRQVGESFRPPKTCTTVSWTFRCFYEKALLEYEKYQMHGEEYTVPDHPTEMTNLVTKTGSSARSGRARRDAAARAMQGWHSQRLLSNGEVSDPIIKDKNSSSTQKREKQLKSTGLLKRKKSSAVDHAIKSARVKAAKMQLDATIVDVGSSADWVKVNVQKTKDCFEIYALVPGLLREEVRVQSDPAGRLIISGNPEQLDNPWGVTPFKKVVSLSSRIDPHQASAVVTLHGQLFVRVPFEHSDA